jgi:hypothetical protein
MSRPAPAKITSLPAVPTSTSEPLVPMIVARWSRQVVPLATGAPSAAPAAKRKSETASRLPTATIARDSLLLGERRVKREHGFVWRPKAPPPMRFRRGLHRGNVTEALSAAPPPMLRERLAAVAAQRCGTARAVGLRSPWMST